MNRVFLLTIVLLFSCYKNKLSVQEQQDISLSLSYNSYLKGTKMYYPYITPLDKKLWIDNLDSFTVKKIKNTSFLYSKIFYKDIHRQKLISNNIIAINNINTGHDIYVFNNIDDFLLFNDISCDDNNDAHAKEIIDSTEEKILKRINNLLQDLKIKRIDIAKKIVGLFFKKEIITSNDFYRAIYQDGLLIRCNRGLSNCLDEHCSNELRACEIDVILKDETSSFYYSGTPCIIKSSFKSYNNIVLLQEIEILLSSCKILMDFHNPIREKEMEERRNEYLKNKLEKNNR